MLISHYLTGHNSGGNLSDRVRRIVYFRLGASGHRERWETTMVEPWHEYAPAIKRIDAHMNGSRRSAPHQPR